MKIQLKFPRPGQRIIRSVIAVALCFVVYELRGRKGIPFYSALAVLQCMQPYYENTRKIAKKRVIGTFVGAFWGMIVIILQVYILQGRYEETVIGYLLISFFTGLVLYSTVVLECKDTAYFSCVVFLSIVVIHITDPYPILFALDRVLDTLIGVALAFAVNSAHFPRKKNRDTLFVSGIDDTILDKKAVLTPYSKVELNRLIDDGMKFTVSTIRTPASVLEALDGVHIPCPIIAMDGAVLYDTREHSYLMKCQMSAQEVKCVTDFLIQENAQFFTNTVVDNLLVIYYDSLKNDAAKKVYKIRRKSPYRNYVKSEKQVLENVVYLFLIDKKPVIDALYGKMQQQEWKDAYRIVRKDCANYPGFAQIKIYHKDATRENMLQNLKAFLNIEKVVTFGSIEGKYDVLINDSDKDSMMKQLKKMFEPIGF